MQPVDMKITHTLYTWQHTLTPGQTSYLHESCQNKPKSQVCQLATSLVDIHVASSSVVCEIHNPVDKKLPHTHTHTHTHIPHECKCWRCVHTRLAYMLCLFQLACS